MIVAFPTVSNPHSNPMRRPRRGPAGDLVTHKPACKPFVRCGETARPISNTARAGTAVRGRDAEPALGLEWVRGYGSDRLDLHHRPPHPGPAPHGPRHVERELGMGRARPVHAALSPQEPREAEGSGPLEPGRGTRYAARCAVVRRGAGV